MTTMVCVKSVGIKQLKARLSEYVRLARAGEIILVSDRDEVVAELILHGHQSPRNPIRWRPSSTSSVDARMRDASEPPEATTADALLRRWACLPKR